jgi:DNA polymerase I-like protein with 3'-5' exonuclease and polymerase domains
MSQQEYRDLAHFAVGPGSDELRAEYNSNPKTDYHERTQRMTKELANVEIERRPIKNMNFGLLYGMQESKLIRQNGFTPEQGKKIFKAYHAANPYVRPTMDTAAEEMQQLGYISTILGRRIRFNLWEPIFRDYRAPRPVELPFEAAILAYGSAIKRAGGYRAINYRLQGSNADQIKKGMHDCWKAGIYDVCGVPRLQVHDELVHSVPDDSPAVTEALNEMRHILETCIPTMRVPIRLDFKRGPNWGACE